MVVWRLEQKKLGPNALSFVSKGVGEAQPWFFVPIIDYKQWRVSKVEALPPASIANRLQDPGQRDAVVLVKGDIFDPVEAAARIGFRQLTVANLEKLITELGFVFAGGIKKPKLEQDVVSALCWRLIPNCTEADVNIALAARKRKYHDVCESMLATGLNLDKIQHGVEEDDFVVIKDAADKAQKEKASEKARHASGPAQLRKATPAERQEGWTLRVLPESE